MKEYLLSIYMPENSEKVPDNIDEIMRDLAKLHEEMRAAGAWVFTGALHAPTTATVLQAKGEDVLITDGPFAEGKEHIGGLTIIAAEDLDAAMAWGRKLAAIVTLPIEVRPFQDR
jgi:hypothetical protein